MLLKLLSIFLPVLFYNKVIQMLTSWSKIKTYALIIVVLRGEKYESNCTFNTGPSSNTVDIFYIFIDGLWKG